MSGEPLVLATLSGGCFWCTEAIIIFVILLAVNIC